MQGVVFLPNTTPQNVHCLPTALFSEGLIQLYYAIQTSLSPPSVSSGLSHSAEFPPRKIYLPPATGFSAVSCIWILQLMHIIKVSPTPQFSGK